MSVDSRVIETRSRVAGSAVRGWERLPVVIRAIVVGVVVNTAAEPAAAVCVANLKIWPTIPWSVPLAAAYVWFYWQYLRGRWWPGSTTEARRRDLRAPPLSARLWRWSLLAGGLAMASLFALTWVVGRFVPLGYGLPKILLEVPPFTLLGMLLVLSAWAGIKEEAAFRGYMQGPIERRHGPVVAILIVSAVFGLFHLGDWQSRMTVARMFFILAASVGYGIQVYLTQSILPGIVLHAAGDAVGIGILWWMSVHVSSGGARAPVPAWSDPLFWVQVLETVVLGIGAVWAFCRLALAARTEGDGRSLGQ